MTIIVTGGAGFIGSNFIFYMLDKHPGDRIICVDKLTYAGNLSTLESVMDSPSFRFVKADICDRKAIYDLFEEEQMNGLLESLLSCIHSLVEKGAKDLQGFFEEDAIPSEGSLNQLVDAMAVVCSVYTMFFKKSYFAGEEEYRFIFPPLHYEKGQDRPQFRLLDQIFLPYIMVELETEQQEIPLQSVMVGAKNNSDIAVRGMKYFLKTQGLDIPVLLSDIPLRY